MILICLICYFPLQGVIVFTLFHQQIFEEDDLSLPTTVMPHCPHLFLGQDSLQNTVFWLHCLLLSQRRTQMWPRSFVSYQSTISPLTSPSLACAYIALSPTEPEQGYIIMKCYLFYRKSGWESWVPAQRKIALRTWLQPYFLGLS